MKTWIVGLLLLGIAIPLINSEDVNDNDEDYDVKRFHVQSRQLNGSPTCVVTRRKRSTQQSDDGDSSSGAENEEGDQEEVGVSTGEASQGATGLFIRNTDLNGNSGILVLQNGASSNAPVLFELRPVLTNEEDAYFEDSEIDQDFEDENEEKKENEEVNDNRYKPDSNLEFDSDSDLDDSAVTGVVKQRVTPNRKRKNPSRFEVDDSDRDSVGPKKKPKRPTSPPRRRNPNRRRNQNKNRNKNQSNKRKDVPNRNRKRNGNKKRKGTNNRNGNRKRNGSQNSHTSSSHKKQDHLRKKNLKKRVNNYVDSNKRIGVSVNKGSGSNTITKTETTTQTGTANDEQDVNCIIITKTPTPTTERPFWNILGRNAGSGETDRSFGLRKRFKQKILA